MGCKNVLLFLILGCFLFETFYAHGSRSTGMTGGIGADSSPG